MLQNDVTSPNNSHPPSHSPRLLLLLLCVRLPEQVENGVEEAQTELPDALATLAARVAPSVEDGEDLARHHHDAGDQRVGVTVSAQWLCAQNKQIL